jgi:hypothetical protein
MQSESRYRPNVAITIAKRWFAATREDENAALVAETAAGRDGGRAQFLPRIRALATDVLLPLVQNRRRLIAAPDTP